MKIYTHSFKAHCDELVACALLVAAIQQEDECVEVYRVRSARDVPPLGDRDFIVDIGGVHDGEHRFDHHQDDPDVEGHCAASLVAQNFFPDFSQREAFSRFLDRITVQDNCGLKEVLNQYGLDHADGFLYLEWVLLDLFEKEPTMTVMKIASYFQREIKFFQEVEEASEWLRENSVITELVAGVKGLHKTANPANDGINPKALKKAEGPVIDQENIDYSFGYDDRDDSGETRVLFRTYNAEDKLDFSRAEIKNLVFAHKAGFLLKFKEPYDLSTILNESLV